MVSFVYRGYGAKDAAGRMISAQMLVIMIEIYSQMSTTFQKLRDLCTVLVRKGMLVGMEGMWLRRLAPLPLK